MNSVLNGWQMTLMFYDMKRQDQPVDLLLLINFIQIIQDIRWCCLRFCKHIRHFIGIQ